jgi:hypothetical protein
MNIIKRQKTSRGNPNADEVESDEEEFESVCNKKKFIKNYSISYEIPSKFILQSKFFKKDTTYCLQLEKWVMPSDSIRQTIYRLDGSVQEKPYRELYH